MLKKYNLKPLVLSMFSVGLVYAGPPAVDQLPRGGQVVAGQAVIRQTGPAALNINQTSNSAVINWQTFDLGSAASVNFAQPSSSSATLNRVLDSNPSQIFGKITAPGQVFFSNPNGMVFGKDASVDVGSLTATTHSISNDDFMAGQYRFDRAGATGSIQNLGELKARLGGYIALLAPEVRNQGVVIAKMGTVALAAGEVFELQMQGSQLSGVRVTPATIQALVDNAQAVQAPGGLIILSAQAVDQLQGSVTNSGGSLSANSMKLRNGRIVLDASGSVQVTGKLEANSNKGKAGQITLTGEQITLQSGAQLEAKGATGGGTVLVGGDWQGSNGVRQAHQVDMQAGASIDASATQKGDGGKVVLWSDVHLDGGFTKANGSITARAGALGGNGGQVETSGHQVDISQAKVNAGSDKGKGGLWLLDPYNYTIDSTAATTIVTSLNAGTSFTVTTTNSSSSGVSSTASGLGNITISSAIAKTSGGAATLTLTAANNIVVNADISSTTGAMPVTMTAGGSISGTGNISTNGGMLTLAPTTAGTLSGSISAGGLTLSSGSQILSGTNSYTGNTTITTGTLTLADDGYLSDGNGTSTYSGDISIGSGGTLKYYALRSYSGYSRFQILAGTISGAGAVTLDDNDSYFRLTGNNTYTGATTINGGFFQLRDTAGSLSTSSGVVISGSGQLDLSEVAGDVYIKSLSGSSTNTYGVQLQDDSSYSLILTNPSNASFSGVIEGAGGVTLTTGTQTLSGANTYTGATTINGGTLTIGGTGTLGSGSYAGDISVASGATFAYSSSSAQTLSGVISGAGALSKDTGTGTLTLTGTNTYTGATTLSAGTLALSGSGSIATSSGVTVSGDGVLDISDTSGASIVSLDGSSTATVGVNLGAQTLTLSSASGSYSGVIDGTGGVTLTTGTQTLTGDNTYSGTTTISGGTLQVGDGGSTGALGTGSVTNNGALEFNRGANTSISNVISGTGSVTATITGTLSVDASITSAGGTSLSSTGNLSLNADITNNTTGDITLSAGNGSSASTATLTAADGVVVTQNANADVVMRTDGQGNLTPAQINKAGTGTGDIIVAAGRLISAGTGTGGQVTPLSNSTVTNSGTGKLLVYSGTKADSGDLSAMDSSLGSLVESGTPSSINMAYNKAYGSSISNGAYSQVLFRENPYAVTTTDTVTLPFITLNLASPSLHTSKFNMNLYLEEGLGSQLPLDMDIPMPWHLLSSLGNGPLVLQNYDGRPLPSWVSLDLEKKALVLKQAPVSELPLRIWVVSGLQRSLVQVNKMKPKSLN